MDTEWPQMKNSTNEVKNYVETKKKYVSVKLNCFTGFYEWKLIWNICYFFVFRITRPKADYSLWRIWVMFGWTNLFAQYFAEFVCGSFGLIHTYCPWLSFISDRCSFVFHLVISMRNINQIIYDPNVLIFVYIFQ